MSAGAARDVARLAAALAGPGSAVMIEDEQGQVVLLTPALAALLSLALGPLPPAAALDRQLAALCADPPAALARLAALRADGQPYAGERLELASGRTLERDYLPLRDGDRPLGHAWTLRERPAGESPRAEEARDALIAAISHELRSPLHSVLGNTELLRERTADPDSLELIQAVLRSARALLGLTNDMLDLSAMRAGAFTLHPVSFHLRSLLADTLAPLRPVAARRLSLRLHVSDSLPVAVLADPRRLGQILTNLVANALRHTDDGHVEVRATRLDSPAPQLRVEVTDTGVGVPLADRSRLFLPFHPLPGTSRSGGTGLGLAICRSLTDRMGGRIGHLPGPDRGSTFWFEVPLAPALTPATSVSGSLTRPASAPAPAGRQILVVEDMESNRVWARHVLASRGFVPTVVDGGEQALALLDRHTFDAILMDWQMPGLDGLQTTRAIRALPGPAGRTPILGLSASALPDALQRCLDAGMNDCLLKPVSIRQLTDALDRLLPPAPGAPASPRPSPRSRSAPPLAVRLEGLPPEICVELADLFARHAAEQCDLLERALAADDHGRLTHHAHALASSASGIRRLDITSLARALEERLHLGATCADVAADARHLTAECRRLAPLIAEATRGESPSQLDAGSTNRDP